MGTPSDTDFNRRFNKIIGLGEKSTRKSYYPELIQRIAELDKKNQALVKEIEDRKKAEQALKKSETLYRTLAENVADGVMIGALGKLLYVNPALESILKRDREELLNIDILELIHDAHRDEVKILIQRHLDGQSTERMVVRCIRGDGKTIWLEGRNQTIEWQKEKALLSTIRDITEQKENEKKTEEMALNLQQENLLLKSKNMHRYGLGHLVGTSEKMQDVYTKIIKAASIDTNIVIYGESGTGKELAARSIHYLSKRNKNAFIAVNCGAIPESLFESEFFGHKKGAFSGANMDKVGFFESAHQGTLFLDEIGEIPLNLQVKLLRAIEGSGYTPVGSTRVRQSDVRIIAATNQDLKKLVEKGVFREDFFYRIHIVPIHLPPLKDRKEDIPLLTYHFVQKLGSPGTRQVIPDAIVDKFQAHDWPGNVRELQNAVSRYLAFNTVDIAGASIRETASEKDSDTLPGETVKVGDLNDLLNRYEKKIIQAALKRAGNNKSKAAKLLKIERRSLQRKITRLEIQSL